VSPGLVDTPRTSFPPPTITNEKLAPLFVDVAEPVQSGFTTYVAVYGNVSIFPFSDAAMIAEISLKRN
jgi:hypothetical protein